MEKTGTIAFCGAKFSGKSTSATIFKELVRAETEEVAIAGHLKIVCSEVFEVEYDKFIDPAKKEVELEQYIVLDRLGLEAVLKEFFIENYEFDKHVRPHMGRVIRTPRGLLQYIGTEVLHPLDPLVHVKVAMKKKDPNKLTIITDLRFPAEFDYFKAQDNFVPVYVKNSMAEAKASVDSHASEREFEKFKNKCLLLDNERGLEDLRNNVKVLIGETYE